MALQSKIFQGDAQLEAAAQTDSAHIVPGARGPHVAKIQVALNQLDNAGLEVDEVYGPQTANAVLAYKRKRSIVNSSYQAQADNIVGKMTIAALDAEILRQEQSAVLTRLEPVYPRRYRPSRAAVPIVSQSLGLNRAIGMPVAAPSLEADVVIDLPVSGIGMFKVLDGIGGTVTCDPNIAVIFDPAMGDLGVSSGSLPVTQKSHAFKVRALRAGLTAIGFLRPFMNLLKMPRPIPVIVRNPIPRIPDSRFIKGVEHNHTPCGQWSKISADPNNLFQPGALEHSRILDFICRTCKTPQCVVERVYGAVLKSRPRARAHADWYLYFGAGRDFNEDDNIRAWIRMDAGIRRLLRSEHKELHNKTGKKHVSFEFEAGWFKEEDFYWSFGGIDRVDVEFDFDLDECTVWFQDRYEWHPVYTGLYSRMEGDERRGTNCMHAAFVEMKLYNARDYWMKGQATVRMAEIFVP